jgi:hypothetical protein
LKDHRESALNSVVLSEHQAKGLIHVIGRTRLQKLLVLLAVGEGAKPVAGIKTIASHCGLGAALTWNVSDILRKSNGLAILVGTSWELTGDGAQAVATMANVRLPGAVVKKTVADVRQHIVKISSKEAKEFIEEAICCFENGQLRPAVVFSWVGAVSIMHSHVVKNALLAFNTEARRRDGKWRDARHADDLGRMKEHDFLDVLEGIGSIGKNVKQTLQNQCLSLRNACGHPNSLKISENSVAAHLDTLILNVYATF